MDPALRRRIGGWAAFATAAAIPLLFAAAVASGPDGNPFGSRSYELVELVRGIAIALVAWGLADVITTRETPWPRVVTIFGIVGGLGVAAYDAIDLAFNVDPAVELPVVVTLNLLLSAWVIGFGIILSRGGEPLDRIGRAAQFGGGGSLIASVAIALQELGILNPSTTSNLLRYGQILGLFTILFVIRIGRFAVFGRLPGPGRL